jgi:hypothetical protein
MAKNRRAFILIAGGLLLLWASMGMGINFDQEESQKPEKTYGLDEIHDQIYDGVRLILAYHRASFSFIGSIENVTDNAIKKVRVKVHLSTGVKLGPTEPKDLDQGEKSGIKIEATGYVIEWWKPQLESRSGSQSHSPD